MKPIEEQTILVTGATDGLGQGVAIDLAKRGATVLVHGRDPQRIEATLTRIKQAAPSSTLRSYQADLASLAQVRSLAAQLGKNEPRLDALVNNAGIGDGPRRESKDGIELVFAVNYLSHWLLTNLLLPLLETSAPARIVNVSSAGQAAIDFADPMLKPHFSGMTAYCQSKLAQITWSNALAPALLAKNITINSLHPATYMPTKMVPSPISTLEEGVEATVRLVIDEKLDRVTGKYFNGLREARASAQAYDLDAQKKLRELSERLTSSP